MPRLAQLVMGPAGSGKSTYCSTVQRHCRMLRRSIHVVNLDPAAEAFDYDAMLDIRDLISIDDVMDDEELKFGPNGGLLYCMEYFSENLEWLKESLDEIEDDYVIFDCPGQIELYIHLPVMQRLVDCLKRLGFEVCSVFILDAQFLVDAAKLVSGFMCTLSNMAIIELPHISIMNKVDLLSSKKEFHELLDKHIKDVVAEHLDDDEVFGKRYKKLNHAIADLIDSYSIVRFLPLERDNTEMIEDILMQIEFALHTGDDVEHVEPREQEEAEETDEVGSFTGPGF